MSDIPQHPLEPMLERSLDGDAVALNALLAEIRPYLRAQLRAQRGPEGGALDESSIVQTSLLRIFQHFGQLERHTVPHLLAWARAIVRNALVDAVRKDARNPVRAAGSGIEDVPGRAAPPDSVPEPDPGPGLLAALRQLPERQQQVVRWRYFDHLSDDEIGRRLDSTPGARAALPRAAANATVDERLSRKKVSVLLQQD